VDPLLDVGNLTLEIRYLGLAYPENDIVETA
jgi:hypothetical protein